MLSNSYRQASLYTHIRQNIFAGYLCLATSNSRTTSHRYINWTKVLCHHDPNPGTTEGRKLWGMQSVLASSFERLEMCSKNYSTHSIWRHSPVVPRKIGHEMYHGQALLHSNYSPFVEEYIHSFIVPHGRFYCVQQRRIWYYNRTQKHFSHIYSSGAERKSYRIWNVGRWNRLSRTVITPTLEMMSCREMRRTLWAKHPRQLTDSLYNHFDVDIDKSIRIQWFSENPKFNDTPQESCKQSSKHLRKSSTPYRHNRKTANTYSDRKALFALYVSNSISPSIGPRETKRSRHPQGTSSTLVSAGRLLALQSKCTSARWA